MKLGGGTECFVDYLRIFINRRRYLRTGAAYDGEDKDDAGADHGTFGMLRRHSWHVGNL